MGCCFTRNKDKKTSSNETTVIDRSPSLTEEEKEDRRRKMLAAAEARGSTQTRPPRAKEPDPLPNVNSNKKLLKV